MHDRHTVLKSVHIYKKHRVQYEVRTYFMFVQYKHLTGSTADTLLEYIERNLPEGVALKATKVRVSFDLEDREISYSLYCRSNCRNCQSILLLLNPHDLDFNRCLLVKLNKL